MFSKVIFLLVQSGTKIELAAVDNTLEMKVSDDLQRDPALHPGDWTVIKVFEGREAIIMECIAGLVPNDIDKIFKVTINNPFAA